MCIDTYLGTVTLPFPSLDTPPSLGLLFKNGPFWKNFFILGDTVFLRL